MKLKELIKEYDHNFTLLLQAWEANDPAHERYAKREHYLEKKINRIRKDIGTYPWNVCKHTHGVSCFTCPDMDCIVKTHGALRRDE